MRAVTKTPHTHLKNDAYGFQKAYRNQQKNILITIYAYSCKWNALTSYIIIVQNVMRFPMVPVANLYYVHLAYNDDLNQQISLF